MTPLECVACVVVGVWLSKLIPRVAVWLLTVLEEVFEDPDDRRR